MGRQDTSVILAPIFLNSIDQLYKMQFAAVDTSKEFVRNSRDVRVWQSPVTKSRGASRNPSQQLSTVTREYDHESNRSKAVRRCPLLMDYIWHSPTTARANVRISETLVSEIWSLLNVWTTFNFCLCAWTIDSPDLRLSDDQQAQSNRPLSSFLFTSTKVVTVIL